MDPIEFWKLCSEYSVVQAALLICGVVPDDLQYEVERNDRQRPSGYVAVRTALYNAIRTGRLDAVAVEYEQDGYNNDQGLNPHETLINVGDLSRFLRANNMASAFFDRTGSALDAPLRAGTAEYPPKLDAALKAWSAVTSDPSRLRGKSPKQALETWLTEHAAELGLLNRAGKPNRNGIEEICKVANWKPGGGATPTPSTKADHPGVAVTNLPYPRAAARASPPRESFAADLDDEIPF